MMPVTTKRFIPGILMLAVALSGCTTHYRESLEAYREAEPTPFYQRTLAWAEVGAGETDETATAPTAPEEAAAEHLQPPDTADRATVVAARVLGLEHDDFRSRTASLASAESRGALLEGTLRWQDVMLVAALHSPEVKAAHRAWEAALRQYSQAEYLEGLLREYQVFTRYLDVGAGAPMQQGMTKEFFPYPSLTSLKGEMIQEQVRLAELAWSRTLRDVLVEAGQVFFDYQFQYRGAGTVSENVKLLEDLVSVVQDRYATGLATQPDVLKLQGELERQRNLLLDLRARQRIQAAKLNALLGRSADSPLGRPAESDLDYRAPGYDAFAEEALAGRQEVREQAARVARMEIAIRMGEVMNRPLFTQGYSTLDRGMMPDAAPGEPGAPYGARADAQKPPAAYAQSEAYLAETRARLAAARETLKQAELDTAAMARDALERADIAHRQMVLIRDVLLPLNQTAYDITLRAYTVGESTFIDLLDAERKLITTRLELDERRRDRNQAILGLARARGRFVPVSE